MVTTELEAVNRLLRMVQEDPVDTLDGLISTDAQALDALRYAAREVCMQQRQFNTEDVMVHPNDKGEIKLGRNTLSAVVKDPLERSRWTVKIKDRTPQLFDTEMGQGFKVGKSLMLTVTKLRDWSEMQEHTRQYVLATAARTWVRDKSGDSALIQSLTVEWQLARARFLQVEDSNNPTNLLNTRRIKGWQRQLAGHWSSSRLYPL